MSGPIVRKYGFPNFEQIFGKREPQHGVEDPKAPVETPKENPPAAETPTESKAGKK